MAPVQIIVESEVAISRRCARVLVYEGEQLIAEVRAKIEMEQGADGRYYSCIKLKKTK